MSDNQEKQELGPQEIEQMRQGTLFDVPIPEPPKVRYVPKKLNLPTAAAFSARDESRPEPTIPPLSLPTRWEHLQPKIEGKEAAILPTIIRPVERAMNVIRNIVDYLGITGGCQVLVMRADTGGGKTTFLNTLPHYMPDVQFCIQTIDLQYVETEDFGKELQSIETRSEGVNLIILEGREKPDSMPEKYIQIVLANINRFSRTRRVPMLFVIPTIEDQVARVWCEQGAKIGDLIPEGKLYEGSRWYEFPGVPKDKYLEISEETVKALNSPHTLYDFGISPDEVNDWLNTAPTIGKFMEIIAGKVSDRREKTRIVSKGKREHIWVVYCSPDLRHFDHTFHMVHSLAQDEDLKVSPVKLIPPSSNTPIERGWRQPDEWAKLVATINFLDIRVINLPIITVVTAALAYGDDSLLQSFKRARISDYRDIIEREKLDVEKWDDPLNERRLQEQNARDSMERSNLFRLLRGTPAEPHKGGVSESGKGLAQYLHLRNETEGNESHLHYYLGQALLDLLKYYQFPGFIGVETEEPLIPGQVEPKPDIAIHTETDIYALELHFTGKQIALSEMKRYVLEKVLPKYIRGLPYVSSQLDM